MSASSRRIVKPTLALCAFAILVFLAIYAIFLQMKIDNVQYLLKQSQTSAVTQPIKPKKHKANNKKTKTTSPSTTTTQ